MQVAEPDYFYTCSPFQYHRRETVEVNIGGIALGGNHPIRIQSMTNCSTLDTEGCIRQITALAEAGCDYVRLTTPHRKDAENLRDIKRRLTAMHCHIPLIADVHFTPDVAEIAAEIVEKVRINPGNYTDRKIRQHYNEADYRNALEQTADKLIPLLQICQRNGTAIRIGTNHGSLSPRIVERYGDTPMGMAMSALEFIAICEDFGFRNVVLSMKASNVRIMTESVRLLVAMMDAKGWRYPLHLGVTEAGNGAYGRIKSTAGILPLLYDGIGDTIRVSLTEDPVHEIGTAKSIASIAMAQKSGPCPAGGDKRENHPERTAGFQAGVKADQASQKDVRGTTAAQATQEDVHGTTAAQASQEPSREWRTCSVAYNPYQYVRRKGNSLRFQGKAVVISDAENIQPEDLHPADIADIPHINGHYSMEPISMEPSITPNAYAATNTNTQAAPNAYAATNTNTQAAPNAFVHDSNGETPALQLRLFFNKLVSNDSKQSIIIHRCYNETDWEQFRTKATADFATLFIDGWGDGIWIENPHFSAADIYALSLQILQACGIRFNQAEYIACPSCGRTQYEIEKVLAAIKEKTAHLNNLKIGVMGCIVNGPGEMADADYGFVGCGGGKVSLYKGKKAVYQQVPQEEGIRLLIQLIKENGDWRDPA